MKTMKNIFFAISIATASTGSLWAQEKTGDVILDAMQDELWRNMRELKLPDMDPPFYIMYGLQDQKNYMVAATLGSLAEYSEQPVRFRTNTRVLVGGYEFNDESLDDNHFSSPTAHEIDVPLDDDYFGIRRSFWSSTDKVYRDAARLFQKHKQSVKESGKELANLPHRSFAKSEPVRILGELKPYAWNKSKFTDLARTVSAEFVAHPDITASGVAIRFMQGNQYLVTSEGTVARVPFSIAGVNVYARMRTEEGAFVMDYLAYESADPDGFPDEKKLKEETQAMIKRLLERKESKGLDDDYTGPVLVTGSTIGELFSRVFFRGRDNLIAGDNIPRLKGVVQIDQAGPMDGRIGRQIVHPSLTLRVKPGLSTFENTTLFGSFAIDGEAFVPPSEVTLIENGVLKNLLNNRTITSTQPQAFPSGFNDGPGVIEVTTTFRQSAAQLKQQLIARAKEQGLPFAFIIRNSATPGNPTMQFYKVWVVDGREEWVKDVMMDQPSSRLLRKITGASSTMKAFNQAEAFGPAGVTRFTSVIAPEAILLDEVDLKPFSPPTMVEEHFIPSPLKGVHD